MNRSDDAVTIMPAAISVLKLTASDEYNRWVDLLIADRPPSKDSPTEWPDLEVAVASKPTPRSRMWSRSRSSGAAGSGAHEQQLDEVNEELPNDDVPMEGAGPDKRSIWASLDNGGRWKMLASSRSRVTARS